VINPHTAGRAESPRVADMMRRYAEARARLYGPTPRVVLRRDPPPAPVVLLPPPRPPRGLRARDFIFIKPKAAGTQHLSKNSQGGIWNTIAAEMIIHETAFAYGITPSQIKGYGRSKNVVEARFECFHRLSSDLGYSLPMIGKTVGGRDHSGVLHGIRRHKTKMEAAGL
jgi:hypothetical protein